jgi:FKBP-type peptidyl-prolyl cis-trans isomerase FklB
MKIKLGIAGLAVLLLAGQIDAEQALTLKNQKERLSYIIGMDIGRNLKARPADIDPDIVARGIKDAFSGKKPLVTEEEIQETMAAFQKELIAKQRAFEEKNKREAEAFLAEDKKKEGIVTLPSGLEYKVIKPGAGRRPKQADTVLVHYRATLVDGTEFSNSYRGGQPEALVVKEAIPGLSEALTLMQEGAKWLLFIPPKLAYGEGGQGGPNATLIFEIELISVQESKQ